MKPIDYLPVWIVAGALVAVVLANVAYHHGYVAGRERGYQVGAHNECQFITRAMICPRGYICECPKPDTNPPGTPPTVREFYDAVQR